MLQGNASLLTHTCMHPCHIAGMGSTFKLRAEVEMLQGNTHIATELLGKSKECGLKSGSRYLVGESERLMGECKSKTVLLGEKVPR
jgi:hypothetical protein